MSHDLSWTGHLSLIVKQAYKKLGLATTSVLLKITIVINEVFTPLYITMSNM